MSPSRDQLLSLTDEQLLSFCIQDFFIGSGAGGQHRNKTQSAVRLSLKFFNITVSDCTSRHREENRLHALKKLRLSLALEVRESPTTTLLLPAPSEKNARYPLFIAHFLDFLAANHYNYKQCAQALDVSTSKVAKIIEQSPLLMRHLAEHKAKQPNHPTDADALS